MKVAVAAAAAGAAIWRGKKKMKVLVEKITIIMIIKIITIKQ